MITIGLFEYIMHIYIYTYVIVNMVACSLILISHEKKRSGEPSQISWSSARFCDSVT